MTSVAVPGGRTAGTRHAHRPSAGHAAAPAGPPPELVLAAPSGSGPGTVAAPGLRLDRELDLVVSAVCRQRPAAPADEVALLVAAVAADLAARYPLDGYFPVLVHGAVLSRLPC